MKNKKGMELTMTEIIVILILLILLGWALVWYSGLGRKMTVALGGIF